jgi:phage terminase Nu1 subunit (DNA packaging protein)
MAELSDIAAQCPEMRRANKAQVAQFFDITIPTLEKWVREGMPVLQRGARGVSWVLDLRAIAEWRYTSRLPEGGLDPETLPPGERKLWYDGETRRRELQVRDRELIRATEVEESVATAFSSVAQTLLALPDNMERRAGLTPAQAEAAEGAIHEAMNDLADRLTLLAPVATA